MGGHWMLLTTIGFLLAGVVGFCLWWAYGRLLLLGSSYRYRYSRLSNRSSTPSTTSPAPSNRRSLMPSFFRRTSLKKEDEENCAAKDTLYELVGRRS